jgi:hypothetical protein
MEVQLPDGFKSDIGLVYDRARVKEITGEQQNYLMDFEELQQGVYHIRKILEDLVVDFHSRDGNIFQGDKKDALNKISMADAQTLLIRIRECTYGEIFYLRGICNHCGKENEIKLNLKDLVVTSTPDDQKGGILEVELPRSKKKAQLKLMGLDSMQKTFDIFKNEKAKKELVTTMAALSLKSLDGKENPTSDDLKPIPMPDIHFINKKYEKMGGNIDDNVTHNCKECKKDFDTKLNVVDPNFFSPTLAFTQENT